MIEIQTEISEMKNMVCKIKNSLDDFTIRINAAEERIRKFNMMCRKPPDTRRWEKTLKIREQITGEFGDEIKRNRIRIIRFPKSQGVNPMKKQESKISLLRKFLELENKHTKILDTRKMKAKRVRSKKQFKSRSN